MHKFPNQIFGLIGYHLYPDGMATKYRNITTDVAILSKNETRLKRSFRKHHPVIS